MFDAEASCPDLSNDLAVEVIKTLAQQPHFMPFFLPDLSSFPRVGTFAATALAALENDAAAVGLRIHCHSRRLEGREAFCYSLQRGTTVLARRTIETDEGGFFWREVGRQWEKFQKEVADAIHVTRESGMVPTIPFVDDYLLSHHQTYQVSQMGAVYCRVQFAWWVPEATQESVKAILLPRTCVTMGPLTEAQEDLIRQIVPDQDLQPVHEASFPGNQSKSPFSNTPCRDFGMFLVATHQKAVRAAFQRAGLDTQGMPF